MHFAKFPAVLLGAALIVLANFAASTTHAYGNIHYGEATEESDAATEDGATPIVTAPAVTLDSNSSGCGKRAAHTGEFNLTTTDGNKKSRTYLVQLPASYEPSRAYPLIFVFHGAGGNSAQSYSWGLQNVSGASDNAIFVFPNGIKYLSYGVGWDDSKNGYDMPFFDNMLKAVQSGYCVNSRRVFAAGFSWGGDFVTALTCARGAIIRAAEVNSATDEFTNKSNATTYQNSPCPSSSHPAVRFEHAAGSDSEYPAPYFATSSSLYRRFNACSSSATKITASTTAKSCVSYNSCSKQYLECTFSSSIGHNLPPNWAKDTWAFFATFT